MVEIVMRILRDLQHLRSTDAMMKQQLALLLGEEAAQIAWARLGAWRREEKLTGLEFPPGLNSTIPSAKKEAYEKRGQESRERRRKQSALVDLMANEQVGG